VAIGWSECCAPRSKQGRCRGDERQKAYVSGVCPCGLASLREPRDVVGLPAAWFVWDGA